MTGIFFALLFGVLLMGIVHAGDRKHGPAMMYIIVGGYMLRLGFQMFVRNVQIFSHEAGGDCVWYEHMAMQIARYWDLTGVSFMTQDDLPMLGPTVLPSNLFAGIIFLNGGEADRVGCTALVAFAAALTCYNCYHLAVQQLGADPKRARWTMALFYLGPTYLHYTSDMFKDGLVACFAVGAFASAVRLMHRISVLHIAIGLGSLWALWYVRYYLVFVTAAPLLVGLLGMRTRSLVRPILAALALSSVAMALLSFTNVTQDVSSKFEAAYQVGTAGNVLADNARGGSGVTFDDGGSPTGQLWLKLIYTLGAPFPWSSGSVAFHIGKLDVFIIYFFMLRAWAVGRSKELTLIGLMAATFIIPSAIMYATSMSNVGLIARQRLPIVVILAFLASLYRPELKKSRQLVSAPALGGLARPEPALSMGQRV